MGADSGAENVHGQQRIVAVADETARCAQGVAPYDIARASDANAAAAREAAMPLADELAAWSNELASAKAAVAERCRN